MTDKELAARIRLLRRLGVSEFEGDGMRFVLGPLERRPRLPKGDPPAEEEPPAPNDDEDLRGHPSQYWADAQKKRLDRARGESQ